MLRRILPLAVATTLLLGLPLAAVLLHGAQADVTGPPTAEAHRDIPDRLRDVYMHAVDDYCPALPWSVLAAVGKVESDHARLGGAVPLPGGTTSPPILGQRLDGTPGVRRILDTDHGRLDGDRKFDRPVGPMQFIPGTWANVGFDADGDGHANPHDVDDAIPAAARKLCAAGADDPARLRQALWTYNHSWDYVDDVLAHVARYATAVPLGPTDPVLVEAVLNNSRLDIYSAGRDDVVTGRIDNRILAILEQASEHWTLGISSLQTGHSKCVGGGDYPGCRISNHWYGRAVDIHRVNGQPVTSSNEAAYDLAAWLASLPEELRLTEVGSPWIGLTDQGGYFTDNGHQDHIHVGIDIG